MLFFTAHFLLKSGNRKQTAGDSWLQRHHCRDNSGNSVPERKTILTMLAEAFYNNGAVAEKIQKLTKKSENCRDSIGM
jgi:hypothetical protein